MNHPEMGVATSCDPF